MRGGDLSIRAVGPECEKFGRFYRYKRSEWGGLERLQDALKNSALCSMMCIARCMMRTNVVLNDELVDEAFRYSGCKITKKDLIETALQEYVNTRKRKDIKELKGKIQFREGYDYKAMRE
jgi:Arc/MetJ family transcription regulator